MMEDFMKRYLCKLIALVTSISTLMVSTGCNRKDDNSVSDVTTEIVSCDDGFNYEYDFIDAEMDDDISRVIDSFKDVKISYDNEEVYISSSDVSEIIDDSFSNYECKNENMYNSDVLFNIIKSNSADYVLNNKGVYSSFSYSDCDEEQIAFEGALKRYLDEYYESASNDVMEDICNFSSLKIVFKSVPLINSSYKVYGTYDNEENVMFLYPDNIRNKALKNNKTFEEEMYYTIKHEFNHVRQMICGCKLDAGDAYDVFKFDKYYSFILEACAESEFYNSEKSLNENIFFSPLYVYDQERKEEALLFLLAMFGEYDIDEYYNRMFDADLKGIHEYFDLNSDGEIYDFYRIIYAMDSILRRNNYSEKVKGNIDTFQLSEVVGFDYKANIFKLWLYDLFEYTLKHDDFSLEENVLLYYLVSSVITKSYYTDIGTNEEILYSYDKSFVDVFREFDSLYKEFVSLKYDVTSDEVDNMISEYSDNYIIFDITRVLKGDYDSVRYDLAEKLINRFPLIRYVWFSDLFLDTSYFDIICDYDSLVLK